MSDLVATIPNESQPPRASFDIHIHPSGPLGGYLLAPPSKNYTTRLILGAVLADGDSVVLRPAANDDARALVRCCRELGAAIDEENGGDLRIRGVAGAPRNPGRLDPGNAGAVLRLLLGTACLVEGEIEFVTDHVDSLGKRPNEDLLFALRQLGAEAQGQGPDGRLPIRIAGGRKRVRGGDVVINGARSSQFLSSLLYLAPYLRGDCTIRVAEINELDANNKSSASDEPSAAGERLVSRPLIDQTLESLGHFGLALRADFEALRFFVPGGQMGTGREIAVHGDWPSAAALMAIVATAGGMATLSGLYHDAQGERHAVDWLVATGCEFLRPRDEQLVVHSKAQLRAADLNGDLATDAVLALVGAACLAEGTSRFSNIANLRLKECDRIREPLEELRKLGVVASSGHDWMEITGNPDGYEGGVEVDARGDHRVAQMLAIVGVRCARGLTIRGAHHVAKSYPDFFDDLARLGVKYDQLAPGASSPVLSI